MKKDEKIAIYISKELYEEVKRRVEESGGEFSSVEDYVEFVLSEILKEEEEEFFSPEEEEKIKERLKSLGYL